MRPILPVELRSLLRIICVANDRITPASRLRCARGLYGCGSNRGFNWQNRAHFFGVAAQIMRRLLVDHARKHNAEKRGQEFQKFSLDENIDRGSRTQCGVGRARRCPEGVGGLRRTEARMVELRYFGGLSIEETADVLGVTPTTVKRHWRFAKAWLYGEMQKT